MRLRLTVLASSLAALVAAVAPGIASAAPAHDHGLTINATPDPIIAGEGVLIYGRLRGPSVFGKPIVLYQHVDGSGPGYSAVARTTTDVNGFYEIEQNTISTNRTWFTSEAGIRGVYSRTVKERVGALVSLTANTTNPDTLQTVLFTGHVTPSHPFERVLLQQQTSSGDWATVQSGMLDLQSNYVLTDRWLTAGERDVRVEFTGDARNIATASNPVSVTVEQPQVKGFTINSSRAIIPDGRHAAIHGVLYKRGRTPQKNTVVQLWGRAAGQSRFVVLAQSVTDSAGGYRFAVFPSENTLYQVRTAFAPVRHTAVLFEGVSEVATMAASSHSSPVGGTVTFTGTVTPDKAGHRIFLQRLGVDGDWHTVALGHVLDNSTFEFEYRFGAAGTYVFRARIYGDADNVGTASPPVTVTVNGLVPVTTLPPAPHQQ